MVSNLKHNIMKPSTKKILASVAIIAVVFCAVVTSAFVLNSFAGAYEKVLASLNIVGVIAGAWAIFKKM